MIGNMPDAQDLAQDVFIKTFYRLNDYRPEYRFSSWLYRIASNHCFDELRKRI
ncbi:sigma factor [Brevibacillus antibioticus]|uniref:sigma factor n=1 Tax=Brevibacillus antibioticus TaxID=2570228 RepID=UPI001FCAAB74|nr:sigma factor [Brevibacillus antibioticus]